MAFTFTERSGTPFSIGLVWIYGSWVVHVKTIYEITSISFFNVSFRIYDPKMWRKLNEMWRVTILRDSRQQHQHRQLCRIIFGSSILHIALQFYDDLKTTTFMTDEQPIYISSRSSWLPSFPVLWVCDLWLSAIAVAGSSHLAVCN